MRAVTFIGLIALALQITGSSTAAAEQPVEATTPPVTKDDPPANDTRLPGWNGAYRVVVNRSDIGTGTALSADGWLVTSLSIFGACGTEPCRISVQDGERNVWLKADLVAKDVPHGLALIRTREPLPSAVEFSKNKATAREPVHAFAFEDKERRLSNGNVVGTRTIALAGERAARAKLAVTDMTCQSCSNGTPVFNLEGKLLGVHMGTLDATETSPQVSVILGAAEVRAYYKKQRAAYDASQPKKK